MNKLIGKTDLVSGVSRGIGRTGALALTQAGAPVLVHDSSDEKEGARIKAKTRQLKSGHLGPAVKQLPVPLRSPVSCIASIKSTRSRARGISSWSSTRVCSMTNLRFSTTSIASKTT